MGDRDTERQRREDAQKHRGDLVEGSGTELASQNLEHVVSLRLDGAVLGRLRKLARERNTSVSALMRTAIDDLVMNGSPTTRFEWKVISSEGTVAMNATEWPETPSSRSALRDAADTARAV